jgi:hypothetical protein
MVKWVESKFVGGVSEVTLLTPIKKGLIPGEFWTYEQRLHSVLAEIQSRVEKNYPTPIQLVPVIHFARWLILRPEQYLFYEQPLPADMDRYTSWLFFTSNFDGDLKAYLRDFSVVLGADVDRIWGNCEGYPPRGSRDFDAYWAYARKHQLTTHAFYNAYPGLSVPRIRQLAVFKQRFDTFVADTRRADGRSVENLAELFDTFLAATAAFPEGFPDEAGVYQIALPTA